MPGLMWGRQTAAFIGSVVGLAVSACVPLAASTPAPTPPSVSPPIANTITPSAAPTPPPTTRPPPASASQPPARFEPLAADEPLMELPLPDARPAVVSLPLGSTEPKPLLVVAHGAGGRATIHCELWRAIVHDRAFIVCPRGSPIWPYQPPHESGYFYNGHPALAAEITKAVTALVERFGERIDVRDPVFVGYSQGANMGSLILPSHEARFARAVLWEGGVGEHQEWNIRVAAKLHERGGSRIMLACGRVDCVRAARTSEPYLRRGGLLPRIVFVPRAGHTHDGPLRDRVAEEFAWLVEDDPRW